MKRRSAIRNTAFLAGCGLSAGTIASIISGCKQAAEVEEVASGFLDGKTLELLGEVVETIIPTTDTPGAKEAGVHNYIDEILGYFTEEEQGMFSQVMSGLADAGFMDMSAEDREQTLLALNDIEGDVQPYDLLKGLVVDAYFTSEVGAKQALAYLPIPGEWVPCMDLSETGGKQWAL